MICIPASTSAAVVTPSSDASVANGVYVPAGITNGDVKPAVSATPLADFLMQLEEYTPTVSPSAHHMINNVKNARHSCVHAS